MFVKARTHLVNFRLTEEEYESLKQACAAVGARTLSDYVRDNVLQSCNHQAASPGAEKVMILGHQTWELERTIHRLGRILEEMGVSVERHGHARSSEEGVSPEEGASVGTGPSSH